LVNDTKIVQNKEITNTLQLPNLNTNFGNTKIKKKLQLLIRKKKKIVINRIHVKMKHKHRKSLLKKEIVLSIVN